MGVWNETARVLERSPSNSQALGYQSLVRLAMGQTDVAVTLLTKALASDPDMIDGYAYLALAYTRIGSARDADATIAKASKRFPQRAADFQEYHTELSGKAATPASASAAGANRKPPAGVTPPG